MSRFSGSSLNLEPPSSGRNYGSNTPFILSDSLLDQTRKSHWNCHGSIVPHLPFKEERPSMNPQEQIVQITAVCLYWCFTEICERSLLKLTLQYLWIRDRLTDSNELQPLRTIECLDWNPSEQHPLVHNLSSKTTLLDIAASKPWWWI